jgi:hypothetical protein
VLKLKHLNNRRKVGKLWLHDRLGWAEEAEISRSARDDTLLRNRKFNAAQIRHEASQLSFLTTSSPILNSPDMSHLAPSASSLQSTRRFGHPGQGAICSEPERQRYVLSSGCAYQLTSKHGLRPTVHILRLSMPSTMIRFLTYFISINRPSLKRIISSIPDMGSHGIVNDGGTNSHTYAKDGETSYSDQHPT